MSFIPFPAITPTDRKVGSVELKCPPRKGASWMLPARSLHLAALPRLLLVMFPLGLGKFWGLRKQGIHLTLLLGDKESRKPGPPLAFPIPHELELRLHQRPPILRVLTLGS